MLEIIYKYGFKNKRFKFLIIISLFALLMATLIYWRENDIQDQISYLWVVGWQVVIWIPWALALPFFQIISKRANHFKYPSILLYGIGLIWVSIHFGWFFFVSSYYSPYLGFPATRYGVYPYFFIFWSAIDIGLLWFVFAQINRNKEDSRTFDPIRIELVRGDKKYFCEPRQVYWLAADNYYTKLYTEYGTFLMRKSLKHFKDLLPPEEFKKIHRSTVINISQVSQLVRGKNDSLEVVLKDGNKRRVSRKYMKELRNILHAGSF